MPAINNLINELSEDTVAHQVGAVHDSTRAKHQIEYNTVRSFPDFIDVIADYYNYHFQCVYNCGPLSRFDAEGQVKNLVEQIYRQNQGDIINAFNDAQDSVNGGVRVLLDRICDAIKYKHIEQYIESAFDRYVSPNDWDSKVEIIRQFIAHCGGDLGSSLRREKPESYAGDYKKLIRAYTDSLKRTSSTIRGL